VSILEDGDTDHVSQLAEVLVEPVSPSMFVPRLASDLECPDEIRQRARALAEQTEERGVTKGVHPAGFAAACLYKA
jgi:transcription initiation factor TFIIB